MILMVCFGINKKQKAALNGQLFVNLNRLINYFLTTIFLLINMFSPWIFR